MIDARKKVRGLKDKQNVEENTRLLDFFLSSPL